MAYYSRQAPRAYGDNSGSQIAAMIGSAASTVAHGVEDYDMEQRKAMAAAEYQKKLDKARKIEAMLKQEELRFNRSKEYARQDKEAYEMEKDQAKLEAEAKRKRQEGYAFAMLANPKDYGFGESAPEQTPTAVPPPPVYQLGDAEAIMPWNQAQNQPKDPYAQQPVQYGNKPALPEDSFEKSLAIGSEAGFDTEQQRAFNLATQKPRDFSAEEEAKQRGRVELKNIWADVQKYAVDHKKFPPRSGRANAEDPIENETDALDQLLLIDRLKKTEQENSAGPRIPASPSAAKAAKWVNLDSQYFEWSRKNPELAKKAEAEYRKLKGK